MCPNKLKQEYVIRKEEYISANTSEKLVKVKMKQLF